MTNIKVCHKSMSPNLDLFIFPFVFLNASNGLLDHSWIDNTEK